MVDAAKIEFVFRDGSGSPRPGGGSGAGPTGPRVTPAGPSTVPRAIPTSLLPRALPVGTPVAPGAAAGAAAAAGGAAGGGTVGSFVAMGAAAGVAGAAVGLMADVAVKAAGGLKQLLFRSQEQTEALAKFSPALAQAQAQAQVRTLEQQYRSAGTQGANLARMVDLQSRGEVARQKLLDLVQGPVLSALLPLIEKLVEFGEWQAEHLEVISGVLADVASGKVSILNALVEMQARFAKLDDKQESRRGDLLSLFMEIPDLDINNLAEGRAGRRGGDPVVNINAPGFGSFYDPPK
jgi:hypothetical protein